MANRGAADTAQIPTVSLARVDAGEQMIGQANVGAVVPAGMTSAPVWFEVDEAPADALWEVRADTAGAIVECVETDNVASWP